MALTIVNLNVFPFTSTNSAGATATVVDAIWNGITIPASMTFSAAQNLLTTTYTAYPTVANGGVVGQYNFVSAGVTQYVAGFLDGEQRSRIFYTDGSIIALPTMKYLQQFQYSDVGLLGTNPSGGANKAGGFRIALTPASANLIDATSPMTFYLDQNAMLIFASTAYG